MVTSSDISFGKKMSALRSNESSIINPSPNTRSFLIELLKITFKNRHDSTKSIYREFDLLKFNNLTYLQNCLSILQIEQNKEQYASLLGLKYCGESHNYMTRLTAKNYFIPTNRIDRYDKQSAKYNCILDGNKFIKDFHGANQDEPSHSKLKTNIKYYIINKC